VRDKKKTNVFERVSKEWRLIKVNNKIVMFQIRCEKLIIALLLLLLLGGVELNVILLFVRHGTTNCVASLSFPNPLSVDNERSSVPFHPVESLACDVHLD